MIIAQATAAQNDWRSMSVEPSDDVPMFNGLAQKISEALKAASVQIKYSAGDLVFSEGDLAIGAYIVRRGKIKLVANSSDGKRLILRIAGPGQIIGLGATLAERKSESSAEVVETTVVNFIKTASLFQLMQMYGDLSLKIAQELSLECSSLCQGFSALGLQRSALSRLARLLVSGLNESVPSHCGSLQISCSLTHEEMGQMIGASRETVSRLLRELRHRGIASLKNNILTIENLRALQRCSGITPPAGNRMNAEHKTNLPPVFSSCRDDMRT